MADRVFQVGTRASPLALVQTRAFIAMMEAHCGADARFAEHLIRTTGDAVQNRRLAEVGGKGLFAKEIHEAMLDRRIDLAVHSLKDLETALPPGIVLGCTLAREDARDVLMLADGAAPFDPAEPWAPLPRGALIGTSSVRRQAQLLHARPDLRCGLLRGNVQTRLARLRAGDVAGTFLALAGLKRLGLEEHATRPLSCDIMVPAACQGIVGVTVRAEDTHLLEWLAAIECTATRAIATAEREMLGVLDGSCRTPIGGNATLAEDGTLHLTGLVAREDGSFLLRRTLAGPATDAAALGRALGASLRADTPADLFA